MGEQLIWLPCADRASQDTPAGDFLDLSYDVDEVRQYGYSGYVVAAHADVLLTCCRPGW
jgi:hypothetical protein